MKFRKELIRLDLVRDMVIYFILVIVALILIFNIDYIGRG
ncbi:hypothetical protein SAMN02745941_04347 [Clostridium intestinale DSM 6191]|uniref:Uncharacterized protein n=1 Tax=Clostridium intestinale DSM 6191 TaxID=1121320 RepID=A0A1M6E0S4_9CLOT|nr:hypothetical protein SAMN02745941_04347 [Clostridium intestinale DSM 6191]